MTRSLLSSLWLLFVILACFKFYEIVCTDCTSLGDANFECGKPNQPAYDCPVAVTDFHCVKCLPTNCTALGGTCQCHGNAEPDNEACSISEHCECTVDCVALAHGDPATCAGHFNSTDECPLKHGDCVLNCTEFGKVCQTLPGFEIFSKDDRCVLTQGGFCVHYQEDSLFAARLLSAISAGETTPSPSSPPPSVQPEPYQYYYQNQMAPENYGYPPMGAYPPPPPLPMMLAPPPVVRALPPPPPPPAPKALPPLPAPQRLLPTFKEKIQKKLEQYKPVYGPEAYVSHKRY